jgi:natural product precursor
LIVCQSPITFVSLKIIIVKFNIKKKMKTLGKLKLNQFSKAELDQRALNALKGGCQCSAGCGAGCGSCPSIGFMGSGFDLGTMIGMSGGSGGPGTYY